MRAGPKIDARGSDCWDRGRGAGVPSGRAAHCPSENGSPVCIRSWMSTHLTDMNLSVDEKALVAAARSGERGALRILAVSLDERLGNDDACRDGAVMAWRAVHGGRRRSGATMAAVAKRLIYLRRRLITGRGPRLRACTGSRGRGQISVPRLIAAPRPDSLTDGRPCRAAADGNETMVGRRRGDSVRPPLGRRPPSDSRRRHPRAATRSASGRGRPAPEPDDELSPSDL